MTNRADAQDTQPAARALRADAQRNRERLIATAHTVFSELGEEVSLDTIASRAGVGIGTLYRHFPNREALLWAVYQHEVDALCAAAPELLAAHPNAPDEALRAWAERFTLYVATKRSMGNALQIVLAAAPEAQYAAARERMMDSLRTLLDAGIAAGVLRNDIAPDDIMRVITSIWYVPHGPDWRTHVTSMLTLIIDGLRHTAPAARP